MNNNLKSVIEKIGLATIKGYRQPDEIKVVAVTKTVDVSTIENFIGNNSFIHDIGESRVQEAIDKFDQLYDLTQKTGLTWHMVGHLQTNKVKHAVKMFDYIQSVDSQRLADTIATAASKINKKQKCLIELKVTDEQNKFGLTEDMAYDFVEKVYKYDSIIWCGLMTIAPYLTSAELTRPYFKKAKTVFDNIKLKNKNVLSEFKILSMGMSNDYEIAVEEGATMVRIGTAIFGEREK